ncbi:MAG: pirin family protein [Spongiibacteraceae bacterium]|jgi:redox-sensitive bicupin YhaK (pirin superfamily)|nr:pirin family protein [Spongiibacteraceae bacterium]
MQTRHVKQQLGGRPTADGAGVRLTRVINPQRPLDPFLMLDQFDSDRADDYIAGFPAHPHRGFETVTYIIDGHMLHEDHLGNRGDLKSGGVQWMTAGRGIIHSEMPQQVDGRLRGFQLWLNLPAAEKMKPANYRDIAAEEIPEVSLPGARVKVIAGAFRHGIGADGQVTAGPPIDSPTDPLYLDVQVDPGGELAVPVDPTYTALVYVFEGSLLVGSEPVATGRLAILDAGDTITLGSEAGGRALVLAARPLREPIVQYGPFVMNTVEEVEQALRDYRDGTLTG